MKPIFPSGSGYQPIFLKETNFEAAMIAPPLFVSFTSIEDYLSALDQDLYQQYGEEILKLGKQKLPPVVSRRCLSVLFGYSTSFVSAMSINSRKYYRTFTIRKGNKFREIQAPRVALKTIQKWFGYHLADELHFEEHVYGFVAGRSAIDAAANHCQSAWVYSVDIEDFFPSTKDDVVIKELIKLGYSEKGAKLITSLCCYRNSLGQGAPSSPVLSNLVMKPIDRQLKALAEDLEINFSRYADDIVFSGSSTFPSGLKDKVTEIFGKTCWKLSPIKEYFAESNKGQRLKVHGLLVNGEKPRLTKGYRNKIRAYKHLQFNNKIEPEDEERIQGHIMFAESVENWGK